MNKVVVDMSMSLDGFISVPTDNDFALHNWYFNPAPASAKVIEEIIIDTGVIIMGNNTFKSGDSMGAYKQENPYKVPHIVIAHQIPDTNPKGNTEFIFITEGIEKALLLAKELAGQKDVVIDGGASIAQQFLKSGLIDEIQIHLVPKLFGQGKRLFPEDKYQLPNLKVIRTVESVGVTHLRYSVEK